MRNGLLSVTKLMIVLVSIALYFNCQTTLASLSPNEALVKINKEEIYRFGVAIGQIKQLYINPIADHKLFSDAIAGVLAGLDPHSTYLDEEEFALLNEVTNGEFSGLGIEVTMNNGMVTVIAPIDDSPAEKAGIKAGDVILAVDGKPLTSITLIKAVKKLRGKKDSTVSLTVINKGDKKPRTIKIKRDTIPLISVKGKLLTPEYGYVRISQFQMNTAKKTEEAINNLKREAKGNLHGIILDLRNNPGGLLDSAIKVSDLFLDSRKLGKNKLIVYTKGRTEASNEKIESTPGDLLNGLPIVVLINQGSASGSEIIAGALQDHKRALVVGRQSFGKGSIQTVLPLDKKTGIKLTIALYYTPIGHSIQAEGIKPDILLPHFELKKVPDNGTIFPLISESTLEKHLANGNDTHTNMTEPNLQKLAEEDHQLYEALQLLRGEHILLTR